MWFSQQDTSVKDQNHAQTAHIVRILDIWNEFNIYAITDNS